MVDCAMGGQYIQLNVPDHLKKTFLKDFHVTWDLAYRIKLSIKNSTLNDKERQFHEFIIS